MKNATIEKVTVLGKFTYALAPVSCTIEEVAHLPLYRECDQLLRTRSQGSRQVSIVDFDNLETDITNKLVHYEEMIMVEQDAWDEDEAMSIVNMQLNEATLKDGYITLYDQSNNAYLFAAEPQIEWVEAEILG